MCNSDAIDASANGTSTSAVPLSTVEAATPSRTIMMAGEEALEASTTAAEWLKVYARGRSSVVSDHPRADKWNGVLIDVPLDGVTTSEPPSGGALTTPIQHAPPTLPLVLSRALIHRV